MTEVQKALELFREKFEATIKTKNSWGKNEVMVEYEKCLTKTLMEMLVNGVAK